MSEAFWRKFALPPREYIKRMTLAQIKKLGLDLWNRTNYQVVGSSSSYEVSLDFGVTDLKGIYEAIPTLQVVFDPYKQELILLALRTKLMTFLARDADAVVAVIALVNMQFWKGFYVNDEGKLSRQPEVTSDHRNAIINYYANREREDDMIETDLQFLSKRIREFGDFTFLGIGSISSSQLSGIQAGQSYYLTQAAKDTLAELGASMQLSPAETFFDIKTRKEANEEEPSV